MAGKIGHLKIFGYDFTFVFRHRFEKDGELLDRFTMWREWELGFFFRCFQIVGRKNFHNPKEWNKNLVYEYMFGVNLLWCKTWFTVQKGGMSIKID